MRFGVLGTGMVGQALATRLAGLGHEVMMGSRTRGNDAAARRLVTDLLVSFGWSPHGVIDLGDITRARGPEMYLVLWVELAMGLGTSRFNIEVRRGEDG